MKNIELYEFFNLVKNDKEKRFKVIHSDQNGIVLETDFFPGCYDIFPGIKDLDKPDDLLGTSIILFFKSGKIAAGFDSGEQTVVSESGSSIIDQNIFNFIEQFNIRI
jgi:hypothetical protein